MKQIPRAEWRAFCDDFSRQHRGWLASVDLLDTALLDAEPMAAAAVGRTLAYELVFQGISVENRRNRIELSIIAGAGAERLSHTVVQAQRLSLEEDAEGAHKGLRIDAADGQTTRLRFRVAAAPEALNGLADSER